MAKVTIEFYGHLETDEQPRTWKVGEEVPAGSDLERVAMEQGWCKKKSPPRNKARTSAPANKSRSSRPVRAARKKTRKKSAKSANK